MTLGELSALSNEVQAIKRRILPFINENLDEMQELEDIVLRERKLALCSVISYLRDKGFSVSVDLPAWGGDISSVGDSYCCAVDELYSWALKEFGWENRDIADCSGISDAVWECSEEDGIESLIEALDAELGGFSESLCAIASSCIEVLTSGVTVWKFNILKNDALGAYYPLLDERAVIEPSVKEKIDELVQGTYCPLYSGLFGCGYEFVEEECSFSSWYVLYETADGMGTYSVSEYDYLVTVVLDMYLLQQYLLYVEERVKEYS